MKNFYILLGISYVFCVSNQVLSAPADAILSFVVSSTEASNKKEGPEEIAVKNVKFPKIYQMHIKSNISNRFATTTIRSKVKNIATEAQEATFSIILPKDAFISGFIMEVDGKNYTAYVKEKQEAEKQYNSAVASGLSAAHVAVTARNSNKFTVSVNIEPETKAAFYLTYEELLKRKDSRYENVINIHPGQPVKDFSVEVLVTESRKITDLKAPPLRSGNEIGNENEELDPRADIEILSDSSALVKFSPNEERQKQLAHLMKTKEDDGLSGQFVVQYDVERDPKGGEVLVRDGYFVHFFAPSELQPLPKHVVFVLDVSGSMWGIKITQLKEAMQNILDQLHEKDSISLVEFSTKVKVWNLNNQSQSVWYSTGNHNNKPDNLNDINFPNAYPATADYIKKAKSAVEEFQVSGSTNIFGALEVGLRLVELARQNKIDDVDRQPLVIFLTDGSPNVGDASTRSIIKKIASLNTGLKKSSIFSLSFGYGADNKFLQKLSLRNSGFSKHIYEASDAVLQLEDFYHQISSPLLSDVTFKYESSEVTDVTKTHFPILYDGSELVVTGSFKESIELPIIEGDSWTGSVIIAPRVENSLSDIERLWAYLTVKQLLEKTEISDDNLEEIKKRALDLCLKYSFVTSLSSLVVVKPNAINAVDAEEDIVKPRPFDSNLDNSTTIGSHYIILLAPPRIENSDILSHPIQPPGAAPFDGDLLASRFGSIDFIQPAHPHRQFNKTNNSISDNLNSTNNNLRESLPWLKSILNDNGILNLPSGNYKLGSNETVSVNPTCSNAPSSVPGRCTLLKDCFQVHSLLTSVDIYVQHFCLLKNEYAGVCCPIAAA